MAAGVKAEDQDRYFSEASSWDRDRALEAGRQKRVAYLAGAGGIALGVIALAWHITSPLKSVEPYVIRVNQTTGEVDVVSAVKNTKEITGNEAVSKYFLSQYVRQRESWVAAAATEMFDAAAAMSTPAEQQKMAAERRPENPNSPVNRFRSGETVGVIVRQVTFVNDRVAIVRFTRSVRSLGVAGDQLSSWAATINFKYVEKPETEADRLRNPLGFQVISYRADPEVAR